MTSLQRSQSDPSDRIFISTGNRVNRQVDRRWTSASEIFTAPDLISSGPPDAPLVWAFDPKMSAPSGRIIRPSPLRQTSEDLLPNDGPSESDTPKEASLAAGATAEQQDGVLRAIKAHVFDAGS